MAALSALFSANWDRLEGKVPFELDMVQEAGKIGANLLHAIGITDVGEVRKDTAFDWYALRARAFRVLVLQYDELRRAVTFLRWHHADANAFAPSLHSGARKRRRGRESDGEAEPLEGSDELPLDNDFQANVNPTETTRAGMPGGSPFEA